MAEAEVISLSGPVESVDGTLVLLIPLDAGGAGLIECSRGVGVVEGEFLRVEIPDWLADKLRVVKGDIVSVNNVGGKFNITPEAARPVR
jgi:hypothetical protein